MKQENLVEFMKNVKIINKEISEYFDPVKGVKYLIPSSYVWSRVDYLELTNEELKKEQFSQNMEQTDLKFNYIETTRPKPKYDITKREEDKYTIVDTKVQANQIWLVSNGLKFNKVFNNKEDAIKLVDSINEPLKEML